jgi:hypothetical protein
MAANIDNQVVKQIGQDTNFNKKINILFFDREYF